MGNQHPQKLNTQKFVQGEYMRLGVNQLILKIYPLIFWEIPQNQANYSSKLSQLLSIIDLH